MPRKVLRWFPEVYKIKKRSQANPQSVIRNLQSEVATALAKLRQANQLDYLPIALLTSALYAAAVAGQPEEAQHFLDEAQLIAERGPMPLYLADVYLHRARLFRDPAALAQARALITKHHYGRRKDELEDAETAARQWPTPGDPSH